MSLLQDIIAKLDADVEAEIAALVDEGEIVAASNHCFNQILSQAALSKELGRDGGTTFHLQRFFYAIKMLQLQLLRKHLKPTEVEHAVKIAESSLQRAGIKDSGQASYLIEELCNCKSKLLRQEHKPLGAQWELLIGRKFLAYEHEWTTSAIDETMAAFHLGYAYEATIGYRKILEHRMSYEQMVFVELQLVRAARLSARLNDAEQWLLHLQHDPELSSETRSIVEWESRWIRLARGEDISEFAVLLTRQRKFPAEPYLSLLMLLAYAHPMGTSLSKNIPSLATLRKRQDKKRSDEDKLIFEILEFFNTLYDYETPLKRRLSIVTEVIDKVPQLHLEYQLLFFLALGRWAVRSKQTDFAQIPVSRYRFLSEQASQGSSDDVLGFGSDLVKNRRFFLTFAARTADFGSPSDQRLLAATSRRVQQWFNYAKIGWHLVSPQPNPRQRVSNILTAVIKTVNSRGLAFGGPIAKILQAAVQSGVAFFGLSEELNIGFANLYRDQQQRERVNFQEVILTEFRRPAKELFQTWDEVPFASGSIAHIFRATLVDGREVALKIRRDDIEQRARQDFVLFKANILPVLRRFSKALDDVAFAHAENLFIGELDLVREAANLQRFSEIFKDDPDIVIPQLIPDLCSANCLTMEYIEGSSLNTFINQAAEEEKVAVARAILRLVFRSSFGFNLFKTDLYESNFRINRGKLVILDFGRVQTIETSIFQEHLAAVWQGVFQPNHLKLPIPESLKVVEPQIYELMEHFVLIHHKFNEPVTFFPDLSEFIDYMLAHTAIYAPMVSNVKINELDQMQIWLWLGVLMTRLNVKLLWVQEFKALFELYLPDYRPDAPQKELASA